MKRKLIIAAALGWTLVWVMWFISLMVRAATTASDAWGLGGLFLGIWLLGIIWLITEV